MQPLLSSTDQHHGMFDHLRPYPWVLPAIRYEEGTLEVESLAQTVVRNAEEKVKAIRNPVAS